MYFYNCTCYDTALFGGKSTQEMKRKLGVNDNRPLEDFLPTLTIAAKNLATEMTNYNVEEKDLPASEDIKILERRVKSQEKN